MSVPPDPFDGVPEDIQQRLVALAATFHHKTGAPIEDIQVFMVQTIKLYVEYMEGPP